MSSKIVLAGLAAVIVLAPAVASAGDRDPGVNRRQHRQQARIEQGVKSGELTPRETHRLKAEQRAIRHEERAYKADGQLTGRERADLHRDLNAASRDIYRQKHDEQKAVR